MTVQHVEEKLHHQEAVPWQNDAEDVGSQNYL